MRIVIEVGAPHELPEPKTFLPSWQAIEALIRTSRTGEPLDSSDDGDPDKLCALVRIHRDDHGADYRGHGSYTCELRDGSVVKVTSEGIQR